MKEWMLWIDMTLKRWRSCCWKDTVTPYSYRHKLMGLKKAPGITWPKFGEQTLQLRDNLAQKSITWQELLEMEATKPVSNAQGWRYSGWGGTLDLSKGYRHWWRSLHTQRLPLSPQSENLNSQTCRSAWSESRQCSGRWSTPFLPMYRSSRRHIWMMSLIFSGNWEDHLAHLTKVLQQLRQAELTVKQRKSQFEMISC